MLPAPLYRLCFLQSKVLSEGDAPLTKKRKKEEEEGASPLMC